MEEYDNLRRNYNELDYQSKDWQGKITTYESRITKFNQDRDGIENRLRQSLQENDELRRKLQ